MGTGFAWFTPGLFAGGVTSAIVLWILSGIFEPLPSPARVGMLAAVFVAVFLQETGVVAVPFPQQRRQIARDVFDRDLKWAALQFGFELGTGARTYVPSAVPYLCAAFLLLAGLPLTAAVACGVGFGAGRALMPVLRAWAVSPVEWDETFAASSRWATSVVVVALAGSAAWLWQ